MTRTTTPKTFANGQYRALRAEARAEINADRGHQAVIRRVRDAIDRTIEVIRIKRVVSEGGDL